MSGQTYSNEELLNHLRDLAEGDQPPAYREVSAAEGPSTGTYEYRFGSFNEAVREAGFDSDSRGRGKTYTDEELLNHLRDLAEGDQPPTKKEVAAAEGPSARTYGYRFESFNEAVREAGFEPDPRGGNKVYSDDELLNHLRDLAEEDQPPKVAEVSAAEGPSTGTYRRRFGSFNEAVREAGFEEPPDRQRQEYTDEELLNHLRDLAEEDQPPTKKEVAAAEGPSAGTYRYRFESFNEAVREAGFPELSGKRKYEYTDEELLSWIQSFVAEFGTVPTQTDLRTWPGPSMQTYRSRFGSWGTALYKAGLERPTTDAEGDQ